jgi:hypothetical protein
LEDIVNLFIEEYIQKLQQLSNEDDVVNLYQWFWGNRDRIGETVSKINNQLSLKGEYQLQPDLPCLAIGGLQGLLVLSMNPGWDAELNKLEESYCRISPTNYIDLMLNFFELHPKVVGQKVRWWMNPLSWVKLLRDWEIRFGNYSGKARWDQASKTKLIGGWELFPFHSNKDGLSQKINDYDWIFRCAIESVKASLRLQPEVLLVVSKQGYQLIRNVLLIDEEWKDGIVGSGSFRTRVSYNKHRNGTEVIGVARQIFSAPRKFTNDELLGEINRLRNM